ncbi:MAG: hypothetical protein ACJ8F7_14345 [Gemmataceae bacterium]
MARRVSTRWLAAGIVLATVCASLPAAPPEELLRLVSEDSAFCVVVRDLRTHAADLESSPWLEAFRASKLGQTLAATPEAKQLNDVSQQVARQLRMDPVQLRDEVFGDAVVFAYQNALPGHPEREAGLILTWARDPKVAAQFIERLNEAQTQSAELKEVRRKTHQGRDYLQRAKAQGPDEYCCLHGSVLMFSQQESAILKAIDRDLQAPPVSAEPPALARQLAALNADGFAAVLLNPRAFDAELEQKLKAAAESESAFLRAFQTCWKAVGAVALTVRLDKHLTIDLTAAVKEDALPAGVRRLVSAADKPNQLAGRFPTNSILSVVGRIDPAVLLDALGEFMSPEARQGMRQSLEQSLAPVFGKKPLPQSAEQVGPDWGLCVAPPAANSAVPQVTVALRVRKGAEAEQSLLEALDGVTTLIRFGYNANHPEPIRVKTARQGEIEVKYLACDGFPPGFQPAYAVKNGFLVVASSPTAVAAFGSGSLTAKSAPIISLAFRQLDSYLSAHQADLVSWIAAGDKVSKDDAVRQIEYIRVGIELLDRLELSSDTPQPGRPRLSLRLSFTKPLKK